MNTNEQISFHLTIFSIHSSINAESDNDFVCNFSYDENSEGVIVEVENQINRPSIKYC